MKWVVITGGGGGIGRILVHHFSREHRVLTCGRRRAALEATRAGAPRPDRVVVREADVARPGDREAFVAALPPDAALRLLVQNAAVGDPAELDDVDVDHLEYALRVNVVAPLALVRSLRPHLHAGGGRVLHLGTSVAHSPQRGTLTYGVSKMAFHRLYRQLNAEGVVCGSLSPGLVDTEGVRDHVAKARSRDLPHVAHFDRAFENGWKTPPEKLVEFITELLEMDDATFASKEWRFSEWSEMKANEAESPP